MSHQEIIRTKMVIRMGMPIVRTAWGQMDLWGNLPVKQHIMNAGMKT